MQTSEDPATRWKWVDYSAFDAKATFDLYHSLRDRLRATHCAVDEALRPGLTGRLDYTQWDLYLDTVRPFGAVLTEMENVRPRSCPQCGNTPWEFCGGPSPNCRTVAAHAGTPIRKGLRLQLHASATSRMSRAYHMRRVRCVARCAHELPLSQPVR